LVLWSGSFLAGHAITWGDKTFASQTCFIVSVYGEKCQTVFFNPGKEGEQWNIYYPIYLTPKMPLNPISLLNLWSFITGDTMQSKRRFTLQQAAGYPISNFPSLDGRGSRGGWRKILPPPPNLPHQGGGTIL